MKICSNFFQQLFSEDFISEYNHSNYIDNFDKKRFFHMDCSGFIYWYLLHNGYARALVELRNFLKENDFIKINRFFCKDFVFISEHKTEFKHWDFIEQPVQNCILVVVFPDGNGHCMLIDQILHNDKNRLVLGVIDSTQYPHKNDTRTETGIGYGEIELILKDNYWFYDAGNTLLPTREANIYFVSPIK